MVVGGGGGGKEGVERRGKCDRRVCTDSLIDSGRKILSHTGESNLRLYHLCLAFQSDALPFSFFFCLFFFFFFFFLVLLLENGGVQRDSTSSSLSSNIQGQWPIFMVCEKNGGWGGMLSPPLIAQRDSTSSSSFSPPLVVQRNSTSSSCLSSIDCAKG